MKIKEKLVQNAGLPKEIVLNYPKLVLIGENELDIENYKGVIEYSDKLIRLNTYLYILRIEGCELEITSITSDFISVRGKIKSIQML